MRLVLALILLLAAPAGAQTCLPEDLPPVAACTGARLRLAFVGDVLVHEALAVRGYARGFGTIWGAAEPWLRRADLAIANLEGPVAPGLTAGGRHLPDPGPVFDGRVYSEYPRFNYHPSLLADLARAGIDVVTTANNHAQDRGGAGVGATQAALEAAGIAAVGGVVPGGPRWQPFRLRTRLGPLSLIACSFSTNGIADPGRQIPRCYDDRAGLLAAVRAEVGAGAGVIVLPHWGQEYQTRPDGAQRALARDLAAAGALAVIGTHPHVPQPWEVLDSPLGPTLIVYSTGNFIAAQPPLERATAPMVWLDLCRGASGMRVGGAAYLPMQMSFERGPVLTLPRPGDGARAEAGLALLARLVPGRALSADCRSLARPSAPPIPQDRP
ncbi:CapA family protein [Pararhodobacter aggregans]|uniref:Capsular biosynthesis protein n=1 Tax=Pararhodobacter aggregans TaxID=404875 RepID=A0A2T7UVK9_9RHOB|nr:CapA family protein [Pararhodobacter aggregans]PTX03914.1 poly-gamma-glutamate synthesis protein (capsule biosynthesis protein) [Pararhodobacter aggregans]PVE48609.1 capsular biosynthesis protein [Pararhodobacter aggregans]